jgi:hypothetical protein
VPLGTFVRTKYATGAERCLALLPARLPVFDHVHTGRFLPRAHLPHLVGGLERESVSCGCDTLQSLSGRVPLPLNGRGASQAPAGRGMVRTGSREESDVAVGGGRGLCPSERPAHWFRADRQSGQAASSRRRRAETDQYGCWMYEIPLIRTQCATAPPSRAPVTGVGVPPGTFLRTLCATDPGSWASSTGVGVPPGTFLGTQCATDLPGYEYLARKPASTGSVTPVTNRESSQASQATAAEMSLGSSHGSAAGSAR